MNRKFWIIGGLVLVAVVVVALLFLLPSGGQGRPAMVIETINQVDAHPRPKDDWQPAAVGMDIYGGGQVRTGTESAARLQLLEGVVRLSAESIFTVKESATRQGKLVTALFLESGRLWAHLMTDRPHEFTVETGSAVAAVRDTRFSVRVADGETLLSVAEGQAVLMAQEQSVMVVAGQQAMVKPGQPPTPPEPMSDDERRLWASEGEMPHMIPSTPMPMPVLRVWCDVYGDLSGPAGDPASRHAETCLDAIVRDGEVASVTVKLPNGETVALPPYGDIYGPERRFHVRIQGLPQAGGTYTFTAFDADGTPIAGGVVSDVYVGGNEPDPPTDVRAEVVEAGVLVSWAPTPAIPGAFDPSASPPLGFYQLSLANEEGEMVYGWSSVDQPLAETSHLIPFRRQDFGPGDRGLVLSKIPDGTYSLVVEAFSVAPKGSAGHVNECSAHDPAEEIRIIIEGGQVGIKKP